MLSSRGRRRSRIEEERCLVTRHRRDVETPLSFAPPSFLSTDFLIDVGTQIDILKNQSSIIIVS